MTFWYFSLHLLPICVQIKLQSMVSCFAKRHIILQNVKNKGGSYLYLQKNTRFTVTSS